MSHESTAIKPTHTFDIRVYYEDTDAGGIVYHSNYLNFAERARTEMVRALGISQQALLKQGEGFAFAVRHVTIDFLKPARLDDLLRVESWVTEVGGASLSVRQVIRRLDDGAELVRLNVRVGYISLRGKPARMPADLRTMISTSVSERR
jgi:acyl-CoA thioester hydrolase